MSNALTVYNAAPTSIAEIKDVAGVFAQSGMFQDTRQMAQAFVKIMAGQAMGFDPFSAMNGIHIIKGKPSMGAGLIAAAVDRHPDYDFTVEKHTEKECVIAFFKRRDGEWKTAGTSAFTVEDAKRAGLTANATWQKYPKNMLYARAMSNGARWYCAGVFGGSIYTAEELGATSVDEDGGLVIDAEYREQQTALEVMPQNDSPPPQEAPAKALTITDSGEYFAHQGELLMWATEHTAARGSSEVKNLLGDDLNAIAASTPRAELEAQLKAAFPKAAESK